MRRHATIALLGTLLVGTPVSAQICAGTAPFTAGPARVGASAGVTQDAKSISVDFALGQRVGPFGLVQIVRNEFDPSETHSTSVGLTAGYAIEPPANMKVQICPM